MELKARLEQGISRYLYIGGVALFLVLTCNSSFFVQHSEIYPWVSHWGFNISVALLNTALIMLMMTVFNWLLPLRFVAILFLFISAGGSYFADTYGVVIDTGMLTNALQTNTSEALDLLNMGMLWHFFLLAVLPGIGVAYCPVKKTGTWDRPRQLVIMMTASPVVMTLMILTYSDSYANFFRQHKHIRYYANPLYPVYSAIRLTTQQWDQEGEHEYVPVSGNVHSLAFTQPRLTIMVVGETVRADHLSLNGYYHNTMPRMAAESRLVNFSNVTACGTSTAVSVPCMFSLYDRDEFDLDSASYTENVLDVLSKAGVSVLWRDNNSSSKGVADRLPFEDFRTDRTNPECDTECRDGGMLSGLDSVVQSAKGDVLVVLHQMGNHGPAYYKRYPAEFDVFQPACQTAELSRCTEEEINNAYDNALRYTDHFLGRVIDFLKLQQPEFAVSMLYVSDHGESLGENGLYLHGMPYTFAPKNQLKVPVLLWAADPSPIDLTHTKGLADNEISHDGVAPTLLLMFGVEAQLPEGHAMSRPFVALKP